MRRLILISAIFLTLGMHNTYAWWTYLGNQGTPLASYYLGDNLDYIYYFAVNQDATPMTVSYGLGTTTDGTGWTWRPAEWAYQSGDDRYFKSKAGEHQFTSTGYWYLSGRFVWTDNGYTEYASAGWADSRTSLAAISYFSVSALSNPSSLSATTAGSSQINLTWSLWNGKNVMIVRKKSTESWTEPTQGTGYTAGNNIGSGVIVYIGTDAGYNNSGLNSSTGYDYKFYSVNNNYYSSGDVASAVTNTANTDYFRSKTSGDWNATSTWESSVNSTNWISSTLAPTVSANTITILNAHTVIVTNAASANNLTINTGGILKINPAKSLSVSGTLTNSANAAGLVIESDETGTGALIHNTAAVPATVKRYITGASQAWHLLSSPVASQAISPAFTAGTSSDYDFFAWYEPASTWVNFKNTTNAPTWNTANGSNDFVIGKGYLVEYLAASPTKQFEGNLNNGAVTITLSKAVSGVYAAYNMVGNPYPSPIDWKASNGWTRTNVAGSAGGYDMSIWNDAVGQYGSFNSAGSSGNNGVTQYIPVGQGFMVKASSAGTFGMDNAIRVFDNQLFLKSTDAVANILRMKVTGNANSYSDEIVVEFGHSTDAGGAEKMFSFYETAPSLYTVKQAGNYAVDFRADAGTVTIPVSFKAGADGSYTLTASQLQSFTSTALITLEDLKMGRSQNLMQNPGYNFVADKDDEAARFLLHFGGTFGVNDKDNAQPFIFNVSGNNVFIAKKSGALIKGEVIVYNMIGQQMMRQQADGTAQVNLRLNGGTGYYLIKVISGDNIYSGKVFINK